MHTFAAVIAKPGRIVPPTLLDLLNSASLEDLPFTPDFHRRWADDAGRVQVAGWESGTEQLQVGGRWHATPGGVTAFTGHLWHQATPWSAGSSWAAQLGALLERVPLASVTTEFDGVYTALSISAEGHGCITADPLGVAILYRGETDDVVVVSNRAAVAARCITPAGRTPARDVEGTGWMIYASNLQSDRTTFEGIRIVPQGSRILLEPDRGARTETWSVMPWIAEPGSTTNERDAIHESEAHLRSLVRLFAGIPAWLRTLELTGGRDSRLILAMAVAEGIEQEFTYITWGGPELPDVVVAGQIADRFDLDLRASGRSHFKRPAAGAGGLSSGIKPPARAIEQRPMTYAEHLRHHLWLTSGTQSIFDLMTPVRGDSASLALTGQFGELLRTNYPRTDGVRTMNDLENYVRGGHLGFDGAGLLRRDVRRHYDDLVIEQLNGLLPPGGSPQDAIDGLNQSARLRRWFGSGHELDRRNRVFPLYSMPATRAAFAMGSARRRAEVLTFELMRSTSDALARMPFSSMAWPAALTEFFPDIDGYPLAPAVPRWTPPTTRKVSRRPTRPAWLGSKTRPVAPTKEPASTAVEAVRIKDLDESGAVLQGFLDLGPSHAVFDVIDRKSVEGVVARAAAAGFRERRAVYDAVTGAMWLAHEDRRFDPEAPAPTAHPH